MVNIKTSFFLIQKFQNVFCKIKLVDPIIMLMLSNNANKNKIPSRPLIKTEITSFQKLPESFSIHGVGKTDLNVGERCIFLTLYQCYF